MKRWIYVGVAALVLAALIGWRLTQKRAEAADQAKQRQARGKAPATVETATAMRQDIVKRFEGVGSVEAPVAVNLAPKVTGRLLSLGVREGDPVRAGQVLARIDATEVEALVRQKEAALAQARSRLAEARITQGSTRVGLASEISRQQATVGTAQAQNRQAQADVGAQITAAQEAVTQATGGVTAAEANIARAEATIRSAQANLSNARTQLQRQEALYQEGATAKENVDNARTAVEVQEATLGEARQQRAAAVAARDQAVSQRKAAQQQVAIVRNKARADTAVANAAVTQARAALRSAQANRAQGPAYVQNLAALRATVAAAEADLRATQAQRADAVLRAPINGVVTARNMDPGSLATAGQPLLSLQDVRQVWVTTSVPEEVSRRVFAGQPAQVTFDALPGKMFFGKVVQVNPAADPQSRQFTLRVRLANASGQIRSGLFGRVVLETERARQALVVPREAVTRDREQASDPHAGTVTVVSAQNTAETRPVRTGLSDANRIAVVSGLRAGEKIVILSGRTLKDGQPVKAGDSKSNRGGGRGGGAAASAGSDAASSSSATSANGAQHAK